jgi:hypothetical protein
MSWVERKARFNAMVDAELIEPFQSFVYYPMIILFTAYLAFFADGPPQSVEDTLGTFSYGIWLILGTAFPALSMFGRHLYNSASKTCDGEPNSAYGGAWLMLAGDFGVWGAINGYMACVGNTAWWGQGLWAVGFVLMGVPGGAMFTYRSFRRLRQIRRRVES